MQYGGSGGHARFETEDTVDVYPSLSYSHCFWGVNRFGVYGVGTERCMPPCKETVE